jgi:hypothetical protein
MTRLLTLTMGTFLETGRFAQRALGDGYLETDAMQADPPGALVRPRGMREVTAGASLYSFYGLQNATWKGNLAAGRTYAASFEAWMDTILSQTIDAVYLSGHHSGQMMWWVDNYAGNTFWYMSMETAGTLEFGIVEWDTDARTNVVKVKTDKLQDGCLLVIGSGCNICSASSSYHYQRYFANGAKSPVLLGWNTTIAIPRAGDPSINTGFFDHLAGYWKASSSVPATGHRLSWLYKNDPMELIRAWGTGCAAYRASTSNKRLWTNARARDPDGKYYKFEWTSGKAEPVKV